MAFLNKEQIKAADDRETRVVEVPEWNGEVLVKTLSGRERNKFQGSTVKMNKSGQPETNWENMTARFVSLVMVDENGNRLFGSEADVIALGEKSAAALERVYDAAWELNGMGEQQVEDKAEDFGETPSESSTSD
jgi:hypothetical protein